MKRYNPKTLARHVVGGNATSVAYMEEAEAGRFVAVEDAKALQRRLDAMTKERDALQAALRVADELRNFERGL